MSENQVRFTDSGLKPRFAIHFHLPFVSFMEIYHEKVRDLLRPPVNGDDWRLRVREHPQLGTYVQGPFLPDLTLI